MASVYKFLNEMMHKGIAKYQMKLMHKLSTDKKYVQDMASSPHYSRISTLLPSPSKGISVLELGCGPGKYAAILAQLSYDVIAVDPLQFSREWELISSHLPVSFKSEIFAEELPFPDEHFDAITCLSALFYFKDVAKALDEMYRCLKPAGKLLIRTQNRNNYYSSRTNQNTDPAGKNLYNMEELVTLQARHGFEVFFKEYYFFCPPFGVNFFWYLMNGWLSDNVQKLLSNMTPEEKRWQIITCAHKYA
jgi:ubiquinone/menaquinone biosynthesis C-methylase UbiE